MDKAQRKTIGFGLSYAITCVVNALVTVAKELDPALADSMKRLTGDAWMTQGLVVIAVFLVLGSVLSNSGLARKEDHDAGKMLVLVVGATVVGGLILAVLCLFLAMKGG